MQQRNHKWSQEYFEPLRMPEIGLAHCVWHIMIWQRSTEGRTRVRASSNTRSGSLGLVNSPDTKGRTQMRAPSNVRSGSLGLVTWIRSRLKGERTGMEQTWNGIGTYSIDFVVFMLHIHSLNI